MMRVEQLELVDIQSNDEWKITYNQLYNLFPENVNKIIPGKFSVWCMVFVEDLLQIENKDEKLLLDVGWYPSGEPNGIYKLVVVQEHDWGNPVVQYNTKSLGNLLGKIQFIIK